MSRLAKTDGYTRSWNTYKKSKAYKANLAVLRKHHLAEGSIEDMMHHAFNAGWSLLISTFVSEAITTEKEYAKIKMKQ